MDRILVLADDLTGALEAGAKFANCGVRTTVSTRFEPVLLKSQAIVIDTETRHSSSDEAAAVVQSICSQTRSFAPSLIVKKTDSTLRGNIRAELAALQTSFPGRPLTYVPAYPEMGRSVLHGRLSVYGVPVHESEFAHDLLNPVTTSEIREIVGDLAVEIIDGDTNNHVQQAAQQILSAPPLRLCAGPAALAQALASLLSKGAKQKPIVDPGGKVLVVNGSMHPASAAQVDWAKRQGLFAATRRWQMFDPVLTGAALQRAQELGRAVRHRLAAGGSNTLLIFGGDSAFAVHQVLGAEHFAMDGELLPGVPTAVSGQLRWITKAGGFGTPDLIGSLDKTLWCSNYRSV